MRRGRELGARRRCAGAAGRSVPRRAGSLARLRSRWRRGPRGHGPRRDDRPVDIGHGACDGCHAGGLCRRSSRPAVFGPVRPALAPDAFGRDPRRRRQPGPLRRGVEPAARRSPALAVRARDGLSRRAVPPAGGEQARRARRRAQSGSSAPIHGTSKDSCRGSTRGASPGSRRSSGTRRSSATPIAGRRRSSKRSAPSSLR